MAPVVTWGVNPGQSIGIDDRIVFSGNFTGQAVVDRLATIGITGVSGARYFTNAVAEIVIGDLQEDDSVAQSINDNGGEAAHVADSQWGLSLYPDDDLLVVGSQKAPGRTAVTLVIRASAASWTNAGTLVTEFCWKMSIVVIRSLLATHQPIRNPVMM